MFNIFKKTKTSFDCTGNLFEKSLETARDAIIIIDSKELIVFWNKAASDIFGYTKDEVMGRALHSFLVRPEEQKLFAEKFPHFQKTGEGAAVGHVSQLVALRKSGEVFPVELSVSANFFDGQWFATGIVRDVTERKAAEEKLRKSESLFATLIDTVPVPVFFKDRVGRYLGFNKAYEKFFGASKEKLIGKTVFDINPPELAVIYNAKDEELFNEGGEQMYSAQVKSLDKGLRDVVFNKAVFLGEDGSPAGLVGALLDVTDDKNFQREIELKNTILKTEQEVSLDAILTIDENAKITSYNHKFISMFKLSPETVAVGGDEPLSLAVMSQNKNPEIFLERVLYLYAHHDEKSRDEMELKDGRVIDRYSAPMIDQEGIYRGRVWYFRDITEQKLADIEHKANLKYMESMDKINKAIQKAEDLDQMMSSVLDAVLSIFDCDRAWLITPCDPWTMHYRVPMERTKPEWPGASTLGIEVPIDPDTTILFQKTRATDGPVEFNSKTDPILPPELTKRFYIQSQLVMEIHPKVPESWMVGMHQCSHERMWTEEDKRLFQEIGRRISDALTSLLTYRELKEKAEKESLTR